MKRLMTLVLLAGCVVSQAEQQLASPLYNPLVRPPANQGCNLYVSVVEHPEPGKFFLNFRVTSSDRPVKLSMGDTKRDLPAQSDYRDGFGGVFLRLTAQDANDLQLTFDGGRHCQGSPFDFEGFANKKAVEKIYRDVLGRDPVEDEYVEWMKMSEPDRRDLIVKLFQSQDRRRLLIQAYVEQFIPGHADSKNVEVLVQGTEPMEDIVARLLSSEAYYHGKGQGSHETFLNALYSDLLGYSLPMGEHQSLLQYLATGTSLHEVASYVVKKSEFRQGMIQHWWTLHLGREPKQQEILQAVAALDRGLGWERLQAGLIASDEYFKRSALSMPQ